MIHLALLVIYHDIVRLHVSVHDPFTMAKIQSLILVNVLVLLLG